jgi:hypothetical protein
MLETDRVQLRRRWKVFDNCPAKDRSALSAVEEFLGPLINVVVTGGWPWTLWGCCGFWFRDRGVNDCGCHMRRRSFMMHDRRRGTTNDSRSAPRRRGARGRLAANGPRRVRWCGYGAAGYRRDRAPDGRSSPFYCGSSFRGGHGRLRTNGGLMGQQR